MDFLNIIYILYIFARTKSGDHTSMLVFLLLSPMIITHVIHAIKNVEIIEEILPDAGTQPMSARLPHYRTVLNISSRTQLRFGVRALHNSYLMLSEKPANTIDYSTYHDYAEIGIGGWINLKSIIYVGTIGGSAGAVDTHGILNNTEFRYFWVTWSNGIIRVGHGFIMGKNIIMEKNYPSTTEIKYLSLFNGFGSDGAWQLYAGIYNQIPNFVANWLFVPIIVENISIYCCVIEGRGFQKLSDLETTTRHGLLTKCKQPNIKMKKTGPTLDLFQLRQGEPDTPHYV